MFYIITLSDYLFLIINQYVEMCLSLSLFFIVFIHAKFTFWFILEVLSTFFQLNVTLLVKEPQKTHLVLPSQCQKADRQNLANSW